MTALSEHDIIELFSSQKKRKRPLARDLLISIGDDAAVFQINTRNTSPHQIAVTQDALNEHVHFRLDWISPEHLAIKAIHVNVSDLAAMGATPHYLLLSLSLPKTVPDAFIIAFAKQFRKTCRQLNIELIGGDTCDSARDLSIHVTAIGTLPHPPITRSGAAAGDHLYVSGPLGGSALGLRALYKHQKSALIKRHHRPPVRTQFGAALAKLHIVSAMTDISDGLLIDLETLCSPTLGATLDLSRVPIDAATRRDAARLGEDALALALGGGEDYELMFTVPEKHHTYFKHWVKKNRYRVFAIGRMHAKKKTEETISVDYSKKNTPRIASLASLKKGYVARQKNDNSRTSPTRRSSIRTSQSRYGKSSG